MKRKKGSISSLKSSLGQRQKDSWEKLKDSYDQSQVLELRRKKFHERQEGRIGRGHRAKVGGQARVHWDFRPCLQNDVQTGWGKEEGEGEGHVEGRRSEPREVQTGGQKKKKGPDRARKGRHTTL